MSGATLKESAVASQLDFYPQTIAEALDEKETIPREVTVDAAGAEIEDGARPHLCRVLHLGPLGL